MVVLSRIYTRVGDDGTTALGDGERVPKTTGRIAAYAEVEEANAALGMVLALGAPDDEVRAVLTEVQNDLFDVGADLCAPIAAGEAPDARLRVKPAYVDRLEKHCDRFSADLPTLRSFILPGGTPTAALLHNARTIARRAERTAWTVMAEDADRTNTHAIRYLNRLSDLLFILGRYANRAEGDVLWKPGGER